MNNESAQKGIAPLLILVIVGTAIAAAVVIFNKPFNKSKNSPPAEQQVQQNQTSNQPSAQEQPVGQGQEVGWETYRSDEYGYTVEIPKGWNVSDTPSENSRETTIIHPGAQALVLITALKDEGLSDLDYMRDSMAEFKEKLENDPATLQLAKFESDIQGNVGGFIGIGEEYRSEVNWYFEQRGLLSTNGRVLLFHGAAQSNVYQEYEDIISHIIESFRVE